MKSEVTVDQIKNGGYRSRKLGMKWRFYIFASVYRNVCFCNYAWSLLTAVLDAIFSVFPLVQPILGYFRLLYDGEGQSTLSDRIWSNSLVMGALSPDFVDTNTIILIFCVFIALFIVMFIICVACPHSIRRLHYFLMYPIHLVFCHFSCSMAGYCIHDISNHFGKDRERSILSLIYMVFFIFYFCFFTFMNYIESNSLIRPNTLYVEWFHGYTSFSPFLIFFFENVGYHTQRIQNINIRIILYSIEIIIAVIFGIYTINIQPFHYFMMNDLYGAKYLTVAFYGLLAIASNFIKDSIGTAPISSVAVIGAVFFVIVHIINENHRKSHEQILNQLDDVENLTVESIKVGLSSLTSENQIKMVIKCGFASGNSAISSLPFIKYCIDRYPNSRWILSFLVFLYGTVWGSDPMSYKFFLHMLSIEQYHLIPELLLFQNVYCYMQCAENMSPIIMRYLEQYRWSMLIMVQAHKDFWTSSATITSFKKFKKIAENIAFNCQSSHEDLLNLESMFPFSASVMYERSIFEADFNHEFLEAAKYYQKGVHFATNGIKSIASNLYQGFETAFPSSKENILEEPELKEFNFLSFMEHHDRAQRHSNVFSSNDNYIKTLSNSFSIKQELLPQRVTFFRAEIFSIILVNFILGIVFFSLYFVHLYIRNILPIEKYHYYSVQKMLFQIVNFRQGLSFFQYDFVLVTAIQSGMYDNITNEYLWEDQEPPDLLDNPFFWFSISHLDIAESTTSAFKFYLERFNRTIKLPKFYAYGIENEEATFNSLFLDYHRNAIMMFQCRSIDAQNFDEENLNQIISALDDIGKQIYQYLIEYIIEYAKGTLSRNIGWFIGLLVFDIVFAACGGLALNFLYKSYIQNIFSIVRTIQPPALKLIANQFNRVLLFKEHHIPTIHTSALIHPILYFILGMLCYAIGPATFTYEASRNKNVSIFVDALPELPPIDSSMRFIYYCFAIIEYLTQTNSSKLTHFNASIINGIYGDEALCIHRMFDQIVNVKPFEYEYYTKLDEIDCIVTSVISLIFGAIFFYLFAWSSVKYIHLMMTIRLIFYFIPLRSAQTNPVLSQLYNGQSASKDKVKKFSKDLQTPPSTFDFFCAIFFDENDEIVSTVGNVNKVLQKNKLNNMETFALFLKNRAKLHEGVSLDEFFEKKMSKPIFFSLYEGSEFSMQFNNPNELFIKDESTNILVNQKRRVTQELNSNAEKLKPKANLNTSQVVLIIIDRIPQKDLPKYIEIIEGIEGIIKIDSRHQRLVLFISILSMPTKKPQEAIQILFGFIKQSSKLLSRAQVAVDLGGPIQLIDTAKSPMAKSRVVGTVYDNLLIFAAGVEKGDLFFTKQVVEVTNLSGLIFQTFRITDSIVIEAANVSSNMISE
ncbi:hypothetical protein TRFO_19419 [Tritrichomonas foetus]|uniref:Uncharacterized protein n=1 Tax=Tritrichomonas foetus TaxID=1144522 RepID=A0A1J4KMV0_9EUKA|nr:hypothetical protein TRFO_19419 [Tritrichomonas foetus]|eukprot:OHT11030.1 hypothetical protein TRFO_19419 [Tritrichomonas foetus]